MNLLSRCTMTAISSLDVLRDLFPKAVNNPFVSNLANGAMISRVSFLLDITESISSLHPVSSMLWTIVCSSVDFVFTKS